MSNELDNFGLKRPDTGLAEKTKTKNLQEQEIIKKMLEKRGTVSFSEVLNEEKPTIVKNLFNDPPPRYSAPKEAEGEPNNIVWKKTTVNDLVNLYPQSSAVSDLYMTLHGACQQPGFSFSLLAPHGTKLLVKADERGNLYMSEPDKNYGSFANVGLNPDFDNDKEDDKNAVKRMSPLSGDSQKTFPLGEPNIRVKVMHEDLNIQTDLDESFKLNPEDIKDSRSKTLISELLDLANKLRSNNALDKNEKEKLFGKSNLNESTQVPKSTITLEQANKVLHEIQVEINRGNKNYELAADRLASVIAECLLTKKNSIDSLVINTILEGK